MAQLNNMVVIRANGEGVPVVFPVGEDGLAIVSELRIGLQFQLMYGSIHLDEEYFDPKSGILSHTISQVPSSTGDNTPWTLKRERYRAYGTSNVVDTTSTRTGTLPWSSSSSFRTSPVTHVKVECQSAQAVSLSSDSEANSPNPVVRLGNTYSASDLPTNPLFLLVVNPTVDISLRSITSVVDCLRELWNSKGCRNVLSKLDYNSIPIQRVSVLPPFFNGEVIFELPTVDTCGPACHAN